MIHYEHSFASDYIDLMNNLRLFTSGMMTRAYAGVGNGILKAVDFSTTPVRETWTITATTPTTFSVIGSVSLAQAAATAGTPYDNGKIKFTIQTGGIAFIVGDVFTLTIKHLTPANVGVEAIVITAGGTGYPASGALTFTGGGFTRTAAGTFTSTAGVITGIVITDQGAGYTSLPTVTAPTGTGAVLTPSLVYSWAVKRNGLLNGPDRASYPDQVILMGQGDGGLDAIYVGAKAFSGTSTEGTCFCWTLNAFTTYQNATAFEQQPGCLNAPSTYNLTAVSSSTWPTSSHDLPPILSLDSSVTPLEYWLVWEPRSIRMVVKVAGGSSYEPMYLGLGKPYMTPNQFPLPLVVGGSHTGQSDLWRHSDTSWDHSAFFDAAGSASYSPLRYRHIDGTWRVLYNRLSGEALTSQNIGTWPWNTFGLTNFIENLDGSISIFPCLALYGTALGIGDILFELDGVFAIPPVVSGVNQAAENTVGTTHVIFPNCRKTDFTRFFALKVA